MNRSRPIDLLGENQARELVWKGPGSERERHRRTLLHVRAEAERSTDEDADIACAFALLLQPARELLRRHRSTTYIACDNLRTGGKSVEQALTLPLANEVRGTGASRLFADLVHFDRPIARRTRFVLPNRGGQVAVARLTDDGHDKSHGQCKMRPSPISNTPKDVRYA